MLVYFLLAILIHINNNAFNDYLQSGLLIMCESLLSAEDPTVTKDMNVYFLKELSFYICVN